MQKKYFLGVLAGLTLGLILSVGMAVYAAWQDPTSAPPSGGFFRVNTNTARNPADCDNANEGGRLWYDTGNTELYFCDGGTPGWEPISP